jgi:glucose-1-phosphate thymidylyltransferase
MVRPIVDKECCGIILAGGNGTRLHPITTVVSKQLLPVYDKPMIYYPLATLMEAGIQDILVITKPKDSALFQQLLGTGAPWGISISYAEQPEPEGLAQAFLIGEDFIQDRPSALILGDNLFHGSLNFPSDCFYGQAGATVFGYRVTDPQRYGVIDFDLVENRVKRIVEKPRNPPSNYAVTGLYFYDDTVCERARSLEKSPRGEYEITDLNNTYITDSILNVELLDDGFVWLDTGTPDSLHEAASFVQTLQHRQGIRVGCPYTIAQEKLWVPRI